MLRAEEITLELPETVVSFGEFSHQEFCHPADSYDFKIRGRLLRKQIEMARITREVHNFMQRTLDMNALEQGVVKLEDKASLFAYF